ncbi:MAG: hypothetical protein EBS18_06905 [Actinobacteria bacterium]|jgi:hypothetical protein|nr:hypothetical protein [Actinomycetota bacterium]
MNQITLRINLIDGSVVELDTKASDLIAWETHFDLSIDKLEKFTHLLYLAWLASKRSNKTVAEFDVWVDTVANVEVADPKE